MLIVFAPTRAAKALITVTSLTFVDNGAVRICAKNCVDAEKLYAAEGELACCSSTLYITQRSVFCIISTARTHQINILAVSVECVRRSVEREKMWIAPSTTGLTVDITARSRWSVLAVVIASLGIVL